jgi:hypothetical protein
MNDVMSTAIRRLYGACIQGSCFPGEMPAGSDFGVDNVAIQAILEGLGLVKRVGQTYDRFHSTYVVRSDAGNDGSGDNKNILGVNKSAGLRMPWQSNNGIFPINGLVPDPYQGLFWGGVVGAFPGASPTVETDGWTLQSAGLQCSGGYAPPSLIEGHYEWGVVV